MGNDLDGLLLQEGLDNRGCVDRRVVPVETPGVPEVRPLPFLGGEEFLEGLDDEIPVDRGAQRREALEDEALMVEEGENHLLLPRGDDFRFDRSRGSLRQPLFGPFLGLRGVEGDHCLIHCDDTPPKN